MSGNLRFSAESAQLYAQLFCKIKQGKEHFVFFWIYVLLRTNNYTPSQVLLHFNFSHFHKQMQKSWDVSVAINEDSKQTKLENFNLKKTEKVHEFGKFW